MKGSKKPTCPRCAGVLDRERVPCKSTDKCEVYLMGYRCAECGVLFVGGESHAKVKPKEKKP